MSDLIANYGYWAVFGLIAVGSLGIPLPGETALITAGIYAGHSHRLSPWPRPGRERTGAHILRLRMPAGEWTG